MSSASSQRRGKRLITEARKEQNRIAQQLYRQRQKDRLWDQKSLPRKHRQLRPSAPRVALPVVVKESASANVATLTEETQMEGSNDVFSSADAFPPDFSWPLLDPERIMHSLISGAETHPNEILTLSIPSNSIIPGTDPGVLTDAPRRWGNLRISCMAVDFAQRDTAGRVSGSESLDISCTSLFSPVKFDLPDSTSQEGLYTAQNEPFVGKSENRLLYTTDPMLQLDSCLPNFTSKFSDDLENHQNVFLDESLTQPPETELKYFVSTTSKWLYGRQSPSSSCSSPAVPLPDPYLNAIQCSLTVTLLAFFHNARCLGLNYRDLLNHKSPFYNLNTTVADNPHALLAVARKPWMPIHLQPTLSQILFHHHPYLDLIPFPALRARAITLAATMPQLVDPMELKRDIMRGGLYFNHSYAYGGPTGSKQPWDMNSWEVTPWFIKKWRLLLS